MTLGRLIELYQAEKQGKQIMKMEFNIYNRIKIGTMPIKLSECELDSLLINTTNKYGISYNFFIKDEEDEHGHKINTVQ